MAYKGGSIVDYLKSVKQSSSYSARKKLAAKAGIKGYRGTAKQNIALLSWSRKTYAKPAKKAVAKKAAPKAAAPKKFTPQQMLAALPSAVRGSKDFKSLSADLQLGIAQHYNVLAKGNAKAIKDWKDTLKVAEKQASPYFKNILRIHTDQLKRDISLINHQLKHGLTDYDIEIKRLKQDLLTGKKRWTESFEEELEGLENKRREKMGTFEFDIESLDTRIKEIGEDLERNKEFLTIEEQSDLGDLMRGYEKQVKNMRGSMAERGLTESSVRMEAKKEIDEEDKSRVKTVQRRYAYKVKGMEIEAERGTEESERLKEETERRYQTELEALELTEKKYRSQYDFELAKLGRETGRSVQDIQRSKTALSKKLQYDITQTGRAFETSWGAKKLPKLSGYKPLGLTWEQSAMYEKQSQDITARRKALIGEQARAGLASIY